jgi:hypothetical protein
VEVVMVRPVRFAIALLSSAVLTACYVVPERMPDGSVIYQPYPLPPAGMVPAPPHATGITPATLPVTTPVCVAMSFAGYSRTGSVTNMMTGKGVFNVSYQGEVLSGEATRVSNEERKGVASAFSPRGMFMSCEYQMNTPYQGAGNCSFSNGASYRMHIGSTQ